MMSLTNRLEKELELIENDESLTEIEKSQQIKEVYSEVDCGDWSGREPDYGDYY